MTILYNEFEPFPDTLQGFLCFSLYRLILRLEDKEISGDLRWYVLLRVAVIVAPRASKNFVNREISSGRWPTICGWNTASRQIFIANKS